MEIEKIRRKKTLKIGSSLAICLTKELSKMGVKKGDYIFYIAHL